MAVVQTANDFSVALRKQTTETDITTTPTISFPVFAGRPEPVQSIDRVVVTDATAVVGDPYKKPDIHWDSSSLVVPAYDLFVGMALNALYPTDTFTIDTGVSGASAGTGKHALSGLGSGSTAWQTMYCFASFAGALKETYEAGQAQGISFSADENGGPVSVGFPVVGKRPTFATTINAATTVLDLSAGYYQATGGTLQYEADNATPVTETNIQKFAINIARDVTPQPTADSTSVGLISLGKVDPSFTMTLLFTKYDEYRATFAGSTTGTVPSNVIVKGSVKLTLPHNTDVNRALVLSIPSAVLAAKAPPPNASGGPLTVEIAGYATKPGSGDHIQPTVYNSKNTVYA